jgi:hypothetical protein
LFHYCAQWVVEIRPYLTSETRVILVGTKLDLLRDLAHPSLGDPPGHTSCEDIITFSQVHCALPRACACATDVRASDHQSR